ncbi:hypothetical protein GGF39_002930 [Coemansia sp. RSA 1721]|nr:hypothetical protein GGF39_002930 [Coemansia sp. RSA 1721]
MSIYTIYVPGHVDQSKIQPCLLDVHSTFVDIDLETFDVNAKLEEHGHFIVLDNDYFLVYEKEHPEGVKCDYKSRNLIMSHMAYGDPFKECLGSPLEEENGIWTCQLLPVLYFVFRPDAQALAPNDGTVSNTIAEFYDTVEEEDFEKFAETARTKESCVSHFFVVNRESDYHVVDTNNPSVNYKPDIFYKRSTISRLASKRTTIQDCIEEENLYRRKPTTKQNSDFQLRDNKGVLLNEHETFMLEIYKEYEGNSDEESDCEGDADFVEVFEYVPNYFKLHGSMGHGAAFGFKVVDGITYLTYNGGYVCISMDEYCCEFMVSPEIPSKERRIQIHYAKDGNIILSEWGFNTSVHCEWVKCAYGDIFITRCKYPIEWENTMKFVIERVQTSE